MRLIIHKSMQSGRRPVFLNLLQIRFPVTAITSILHRASGLFLFLLIPFFILALEMSLRSADDFNTLLAAFDGWTMYLTLFVVLWSGLHHLLAGIRYLLLDIDVGISRSSARMSAWLVNLLAFLLSIILLWGGI